MSGIALLATYKKAYRVAKCKKPVFIAENWFYPLKVIWWTLWLVYMREDCFKDCLCPTIPSVARSNAWPKTSKSSWSSEWKGRSLGNMTRRTVTRLSISFLHTVCGCKNFSFVNVHLHVQKNAGLVWDTDTFVCENNTDYTVRWRQYRRWALYVLLFWRTAGTHTKKRPWCALDTPHNSQGRPCDKALESSTELVLEIVLIVVNFISCTQSQHLWFHTVLYFLRFHKFWPNVIVSINNFVPAISTVRSAIS